MKTVLTKIVQWLERYIPMSFSSLILFCFVVYLILAVSKTVISNYNSNKDIEKEETKLVQMEFDLHDLQNEINYDKTYSFKEKEARSKLGYKAPGENILSLPIDTAEEKMADSGLTEAKIKVPNFILWWQYFFQ